MNIRISNLVDIFAMTGSHLSVCDKLPMIVTLFSHGCTMLGFVRPCCKFWYLPPLLQYGACVRTDSTVSGVVGMPRMLAVPGRCASDSQWR